ncbi:beta-galactosidase [Nocardioides sp. CF8]|uniref:hypothetical protein n=1 Tax=Nocardioides sp. CF8 TaxID=110319 RepID=UPI000330FDA9|nr:hypothetical protein [Nocardioides sp. CF8]EON25317.1 beta-galactosidase [Nocardioides sp. CF8]
MTKRALAAVVAGLLIGGGVTAVSPAGAEVEQFAATNWKKIWKKKLQPLADKRYYTKSASDAKYSTKAETGAAFANYYTKAQNDAALAGFLTKAAGDAAYAAKGSSYSKAESDAKFQPAGSYAAAGSSYSKAESDAKYAPYPPVLRGTFSVIGPATAAGQEFSNSISFGVQFPSAPTPHFINAGAVPPAGCSGTPAAPNAAPGHLCVFEKVGSNVSGRNVFGDAGLPGIVSRFGFNPYIISAAAGTIYSYGSWAARPGGTVTATRVPPDASLVGE